MSAPSPTEGAPAWPDPGTLLPHDPPMIFVERILESSDGVIACRVVPGTADAPFIENGTIPGTMGVEYMAQTIGVCASLQVEPSRRREIGYVISVRDLTVAVPSFAVGRPLVVRATWRWGQERLGRFQTSIEYEREPGEPEGPLLASAVMSVYRPPPEEQP